MALTLRHAAGPLFLLLCILLGGSAQGPWRNLILQLIGLGFLAWALLARSRTMPTAAARALPIFALLLFLLLLVQLVPLPPALWSALPGRGVVAQGFALRGEALPWLTLSLTPTRTAAALVALAVPFGIVAAMIWLGAYRARWMAAAVMLGAFISVTLGALQLAQGGPYLFPIVNLGGATGVFANSNHQATLLLVSIPFLAAAMGRELSRGGNRSRQGFSRLIIAGGALAVVLVGLALNGSLAALLLVIPVALASIGIVLPTRRRAGSVLALTAFVGLILGSLLLAFLSDPSAGGASVTTRADIYGRTLKAIADTMPFGTGVGSFVDYFPLYEDAGTADAFYVNHAHSDPLEWVLETGLPGGLLLALFLLWWLRQSVRVWRAEERELTALAGTVAVAAIMAHSLVDYPLRTAAIQAIFALGLAFMVEPRSHSARRGSRGSTAKVRHLSLDDEPDDAVSA